MKIGMMWYDGDTQRSLEQRVSLAVQYYRAKYGSQPTTCVVHPSDYAEVDGIKMEAARYILPRCFWVGVDN